MLTQNIMRDKWMNIGFEDDELKPYVEPSPDTLDPLRIGNESESKSDICTTTPPILYCGIVIIVKMLL